MKKIALFTTALVFSLVAMSQTKPDDVIKIAEEKHDFGKIKVGVPVTYAFEIKNITDKPVVVENSRASCGCTTPEKILEPIQPGATVKLKVQYNAGAVAPFNKEVYIKLAGVEQEKILYIVGEVLSAEAYDALPKPKGKSKN